MIQDCPHCLRRIAPKVDGTCPACSQSVADVSGTNPDMTSVALAEGRPLPDVCAGCGEPTDRCVKVKRAHSRGGDSGFLHVLVLILGPVWSWAFLKQGVRRSVRVDLPLCEACIAEGLPEPEHVDLEAVKMTFVVHRKFAERLAHH